MRADRHLWRAGAGRQLFCVVEDIQSILQILELRRRFVVAGRINLPATDVIVTDFRVRGDDSQNGLPFTVPVMGLIPADVINVW